MNTNGKSILETGKDGYDAARSFDARTEKALTGQRDNKTFRTDALSLSGAMKGFFIQLASYLAPLKQYRILDVGCGYGKMAPLLSAFDCAEYLGIDRAAGRVAWAKRMRTEGACRFQVADACSFRTDTRFDVVWSCTVLQHLLHGEKLAIIETMKQALAPGGIILMNEGRIRNMDRAQTEAEYESDAVPAHMVPIPFSEVEEAFRPLTFRRVKGILYTAM